MSEPVPRTIDRYRIIEEIGRGAMGAVYRAHDPRLDREVAVKTIAGVLEGGTAADETTIRFEREARVAARLRHPNVVTVYDAGRDGDRLFLVLELVDGESLAARLQRGDYPALDEALAIVAQAADALAVAHAAGIVHRDVKPGNLLMASDGRTLVSDFGIAKALGETSELTRTGMVVGSPAYLSPEQVQGIPLDGRSDLFSLGVVLFELVLRRKPFNADTFTSLVYQILKVDPLDEAPELARLPGEIANLLRSSLAKEPARRIADARLFAGSARAIAQRLPGVVSWHGPTLIHAPEPVAEAPTSRIAATVTAPTVLAPQQARSRLGLGIALGALGATAAVVVTALVLAGRPEPPQIGAAPPAAIVDVARPLAQPEVPATREQPPPPVVELDEEELPNEAEELRAPLPGSVSPPAPWPVAPSAPSPVVTPLPQLEWSPPAPTGRAAPELPTAPTRTVVAEPAPPRAAETPAPVVAAPAGIVLLHTKRAADFDVSPEQTIVVVNGVAIGPADDWDGSGGGQLYVFAGPGEYVVRLELTGYRTEWLRIVVTPQADDEVVEVDTDLEEIE